MPTDSDDGSRKEAVSIDSTAETASGIAIVMKDTNSWNEKTNINVYITSHQIHV